MVTFLIAIRATPLRLLIQLPPQLTVPGHIVWPASVFNTLWVGGICACGFFFFFFFFNFALILGAKRHFIYFFLKQLKDDSHILLLPALFPAAHTHVSSPAYSQSSTICAESSFHQPGFPQHTSCRWNLQHTHSPGPLGDGDTHVGCFPQAAEEGHSMLTLIS